MTDTVFCEQCGAIVKASARFCTGCGADQPTAETDDYGGGGDPGIGSHQSGRGAAESPASSTVDEGSVMVSPAYGGATQGVRTTNPPASPASPPTPPGASSLSPPLGGDAPNPLPLIAGLPVELWLVIAAFAIPGGWIVFDMAKALPDSIKLIGAQFFGFRLGLALTMIVVLVGLLGAAMLAIAWRLYLRDRVGRGLAYAFGGTIIVSVLFSSSRTSAETWAMIFSIVGIAILAFSPRVRATFDRADSGDGTPTSVVVSRTAIAIFSAIAILVAVIYLLLASVSAKYVAVAIVAAGAAVLASIWSKRLVHADRSARLYLTLGGVVVAIAMLTLGRFTAGLLVPLGLLVSAIGSLWLPNDAREFFGDEPLKVSADWSPKP